MVYLDYAANTPVDQEVLDYFCVESTRFIANPNSSHLLGREAKFRMDEITERIANILHVKTNEVIYTSGASEANNLAIKGLVQAYKHNGKHIISTCLEHSSVSGALTYLQTLGYEIDLVDITPEGTVDLQHLRELFRRDTVLVSICSVDSELGVKQPIDEIGRIVKEYPNCYFHSDGTQAMGKVPVSFENIDCFTFAPHKFFGLNGCGILIKQESVVIEPMIHGGTSTTLYRSGTPALGLAASIEKALDKALGQLEEQYNYVSQLNEELQLFLKEFSKVRINSTKNSVPHILNLSVQGVRATVFQQALEQEGVCVSIKSACSTTNTPSRPVYAITKDKKNAMSSWRISISHWTTKEDMEYFKKAFKKCYQSLVL